MIETLEQWDRQLFLWLNGLHQPWLDQAMAQMTEGPTWWPVYLILLFLIYRAYDWKIALWSLLGIIVVVTIADRSSVELFKEVFQRYRPSRNLELYDKVHIVNDYRGGKYGFISSHATNFFGIATFLFLLLRKHFPLIAPWILVWAGLIAYTRIYLGVHYPSDIIGGMVVGGTIGFGVYFAFKKFLLDREHFKSKPSE